MRVRSIDCPGLSFRAARWTARGRQAGSTCWQLLLRSTRIAASRVIETALGCQRPRGRCAHWPANGCGSQPTPALVKPAHHVRSEQSGPVKPVKHRHVSSTPQRLRRGRQNHSRGVGTRERWRSPESQRAACWQSAFALSAGLPAAASSPVATADVRAPAKRRASDGSKHKEGSPHPSRPRVGRVRALKACASQRKLARKGVAIDHSHCPSRGLRVGRCRQALSRCAPRGTDQGTMLRVFTMLAAMASIASALCRELPSARARAMSGAA